MNKLPRRKAGEELSKLTDVIIGPLAVTGALVGVPQQSKKKLNAHIREAVK